MEFVKYWVPAGGKMKSSAIDDFSNRVSGVVFRSE